jgi:predicted transposase YdaD
MLPHQSTHGSRLNFLPTIPPLLFDLLPTTPADSDRYIFESIEVKETAFSLDYS